MNEQDKMTQANEEFEKWWGAGHRETLAYEKAKEAWQAAKQQPLKRLDEDRIDEIFNSYSDEQGYVAIDDWHLLTNAIMDAMQEINK